MAENIRMEEDQDCLSGDAGTFSDSDDSPPVLKKSNLTITVNKEKNIDVNEMSRDQLISKVQQMNKHVEQLRNIITKSTGQTKNKGRRSKKQRPIDFTKYNTRRVAIKILYIGWDYNGYAVQEDTQKTIEHQLIDALLTTKLIESRETCNYHRCGRTDKGVSAFSQVISIDVRTNLLEGVGVMQRENGTAHERAHDKTEEINFTHILNKSFPPEIRVLCWSPVEPDFSSRFNCNERIYKYFFPKGNLDLEKMNTAAEFLIGGHDFRNFCKMDVQNGVVMYNRTISKAVITPVHDSGRETSDGYTMCELTIVGKAFLWHQIRCIVTVLVFVGRGNEDVTVIRELLDVEKHPCKPQYNLASELPLCLYACDYDDEEVKWIYDRECHADNIEHMQEQWASYSIKTTMIRRMLSDMHNIEFDTCENVDNDKDDGEQKKASLPVVCKNQASVVFGRFKPKKHIPLLERQKAESLDSRIEYYAKRRKIIVESEDS